MNGERVEAPPVEPPIVAPAVVIAFSGSTDAACTISAPGVSLAQLMTAAYYLDVMAHEAAAGSLRAAAAQSLGVPTLADLDALRRAGRL